MVDITYFDLELDDFRKEVCSPNTAKTRYALNFKNVSYNTEWVTFSNLEDIIKPITKCETRPTVPVLVDKRNEKVLSESWEIAKYLEETFPTEPSLFNGNQGVHRFFQTYCEQHVLVPVFTMVILNIYELSGDYKEEFRRTREAMIGARLEDFAGRPEDHIPALKTALAPVHDILKTYPFISGNQAGWADISLASCLTVGFKLRPDLFQSHVLDVLGDDLLANWWKRTEYFRG